MYDQPSFEKALYSLAPNPTTSTPDQCSRCQQPIPGNYYRINGDLACESCARQATPNLPADSHAAFTRAILYGIGAAIVGMIAYALFEIGTGIVIGYLAIGVGYLVGKAMKVGSKGRGGRRYQIAAAILTYISVSMAAVPVAIYQYSKHHAPPATASSSASSSGNATAPAPAPPSANPSKVARNLGMLLVGLVGVGLASPFMELTEGFGGIIGLFILFLGIRAAWNLMAGHDFATNEISGPYTSTQQPDAV
jgi:hypothetical protein